MKYRLVIDKDAQEEIIAVVHAPSELTQQIENLVRNFSGPDSILGVKQVGGICGALLTNLSAWLSGVWFDLNLVGGFFEKTANVLPFVHAAEMEKALVRGDFALAAGHILPVVVYAGLVTAIAVCCFLGQMKKQ